jgi:orotate phosphoribosyltransferase
MARHLLETGSIRFDPEHPFRHRSGLVSPLHVESRRLLAFPKVRDEVLTLALRMIEQEIGEGALDAIAAGEGAGLPFATLIADRLGLPLIFVRKEEPEAHCAFKHRIEGHYERGWRALLVEQLATDGHRKCRFAGPLQEAGLVLSDVFVLFQYGIFNRIHENLAPLGLTIHALATWWDVLEVANAATYLDEMALGEIHAFLHDPDHWTDRRHGRQAVA